MANLDLDTVVKTIVTELIAKSEPFTALDVSNKVKENTPDVRHRDVSPIVREMYATGGMGNYERTNIRVKLPDGGDTAANLYHSLADTWDLDTKYDDGKRAQAATPVSVRPDSALGAAVAAAVASNPATTNDFITQVNAGMADIDAGRTKSHAQVMDELKAIYKAPVKIQTPTLPPSIWDGMLGRFRKKLIGG